MRFLFAWEQGGRLGHLSQLSPIARVLKKRGHGVLCAVKDLGTARLFLDGAGFGCIQAPFPVGLARARRGAVSFADILSQAGFGDAAVLGGMVRGWQTVFDLYKPDAILSQHAPVAAFSANLHGIPCLKLGTGFESPPETSPYPCFRPWLKLTREELLTTEGRLLDNVNGVRGDFGGAPLARLHQAIRADVSLLATLPELEHYPGRKNGRYVGPLFTVDEGEAVHWSGNRERRIFVYLLPAVETPLILDALHGSGAEVVAFIPGISVELKQRYRGTNIRITSGKIRLSGLLPGMSLAVTNGNIGTLSATLLSGVPGLCMPTHMEQLMCSWAMERIGAGIVLNPEQVLSRFEETLHVLLSGDGYRDRAVEFAGRYERYDQREVVGRLANTLEKMGTK